MKKGFVCLLAAWFFLVAAQQEKNHKMLDPNRGRLFARWTDTEKPFWISLHTPTYDPIRWNSIMEQGAFYEHDLTECFCEILSEAGNVGRVVDVGGNVGWFTLLSASMGYAVDVLEPNPLNVLRLQESIQLNGWNNITIHPVGAHAQDAENEFVFVDHAENPGQSGLRAKKKKTGRPEVRAVRLDTLARDWKDVVILKVDVEGKEHAVMLGAQAWLASRTIQNILMEITVKRPAHHDRVVPMLRNILDHGYVLHKHGGHSGPVYNSPSSVIVRGSKANNDTSHIGIATRIANHCYNGKAYSQQMNLWFKLKQ